MEEKENRPKQQTTPRTQEIELRSEKVRNIIGDIPSAPVRWGITVVAVIMAALLATVLCIRYPYGHGETIFEHLFIV